MLSSNIKFDGSNGCSCIIKFLKNMSNIKILIIILCNFKESSNTNIKEMLRLYEAAQVRTYTGGIIEKAHAFTKTKLKENIQHNSNSFLIK